MDAVWHDVVAVATENSVVVAAVVVVASSGLVVKLLCSSSKGAEGSEGAGANAPEPLSPDGEEGEEDEEMEMVLDDQRNALIADLQSDELSVLFDEDIQITYEQLDFLLQHGSHARVSKSLAMLACRGKSFQSVEPMVEAVVNDMTVTRGDTLAMLQRDELTSLFTTDQEMTEGDLDDLLINGGGLLRLYYTLSTLVAAKEAYPHVDGLLDAVRGVTDEENNMLCDFLDSEEARTLLPDGEILITEQLLDEMVGHNGGVDKLLVQLRVYASEGTTFDNIHDLTSTVCDVVSLSTEEEQASFTALVHSTYTLAVKRGTVDDYVECAGGPAKAEELVKKWKKKKRKISSLEELQAAFQENKVKVLKEIKQTLASKACKSLFESAKPSGFDNEFCELVLLNARSEDAFHAVIEGMLKNKDKLEKMDDLLQKLAHYEASS